MPEITLRDIQSKVVSQMLRMCHPLSADPKSISKAAESISGAYDKKTCKVFSICARQVTRWYNYWLDYLVLPCMKKKYSKAEKMKWTYHADAELIRVVTECPVLFLDEISNKIFRSLKIRFTTTQISKRLRVTAISKASQ